MLCPYCRKLTRVVYGDNIEANGIPAYQRRRFCARCNERFTTCEKPLSVDPDKLLRAPALDAPEAPLRLTHDAGIPPVEVSGG